MKQTMSKKGVPKRYIDIIYKASRLPLKNTLWDWKVPEMGVWMWCIRKYNKTSVGSKQKHPDWAKFIFTDESPFWRSSAMKWVSSVKFEPVDFLHRNVIYKAKPSRSTLFKKTAWGEVLPKNVPNEEILPKIIESMIEDIG